MTRDIMRNFALIVNVSGLSDRRVVRFSQSPPRVVFGEFYRIG